jgi:hypothetical protein
MSQSRGQTVVSFKAAATLSAYRIVGITANNTVGLPDTTTVRALGVTLDDSEGGAGSAVSVVIAGTAKVKASAAVTAGAVVIPTTAGLAAAGTILLGTTTSTIPNYIGKCIVGGATDSVIEVTVNPIG